MFDRERLLANLKGDDRLLAAQLLDKAQESLERGRPVATDFLDPAARQLTGDLFSYVEGLRVLAFGGHRRLERARLVLLPHYFLEETVEPPVAAVEVRGRFEGQASHRDFLGALMSLGIRREKIGDIIVTEDGCQIVVAPELVEAVKRDLTRVADRTVQVDEIDLERLAIPPERVKEIRSTVASLRLDAVASLGYGESRTKMQREIKAGRVKVNWRLVTSPDHEVDTGDVLSIRGRGRVVVESLTGTSKKGRTGLLLKRLM